MSERKKSGESGQRDSAPRANATALKRIATADPGVPEAQGLYDPALDKDACGVGFIADIKGRKSHKIVDDALQILCNLEHRGATGADPRMGDGAGILVQIPHKFFAKKASCRNRANTPSATFSCRPIRTGGRSSATFTWK